MFYINKKTIQEKELYSILKDKFKRDKNKKRKKELKN